MNALPTPEKVTGPTKQSRVIKSRWHVGQNHEGNPVYVEVSTSHSKERKTYSTLATEIVIETNDAYSVIRWSSASPRAAIAQRRVDRYSAKDLQSFHDTALAVWPDLQQTASSQYLLDAIHGKVLA